MRKNCPVFADHIAHGTLVLCNGLISYHSLSAATDRTVKECHKITEEKGVFSINTVNGLHSFIKHRYNFYRSVATQCLNRYNTLFIAAYTNVNDLISRLCHALLNVGSANHSHNSRDVRKLRLLTV